MSNIERYADFISNQLKKLRIDEAENQSSEASMEEIKAGAKHHGIDLGDNFKTYEHGGVKFVQHHGGATPINLLAPQKAKTADGAFHAGMSHGQYPDTYKKMELPEGHPHKAAYEKGYEMGNRFRGSERG